MRISLAEESKGLKMKINDIIKEQGVWQGIKTIGQGLGQVGKGVGMGVARGLDKIGGGTGQVGTKAQIAAYNAANKTKKMAAASAAIPEEALTDFTQELAKMGIDLADARTFNPDQVEAFLKNWALEYFSGGQGTGIKQYIAHTSTSVPVPTIINKKSALQYFTRMNQIRDDALSIVAQQSMGKIAPTHPAGGNVAPGITLVNDDPPIIGYKNKNYTLDEVGFWEDDKGNRLKDAYQVFLYKQADILIPGSAAIDLAFDKFERYITQSPNEVGAKRATDTPAARKPITVKVGNEVITKGEDGRWYDPSGEYIGNPNDIAELERRAAPASAGAYVK